MKEKTNRRIESMKKDYNFGVEVEMNGIRRKDAARIAASFFGTDRYENTEDRNGYRTWSAYSEDNREWKFSRDCSIAGPDEEKCELVTPILGWDDIPTLQELLRRLRKAGAVSNPSVGAGVHIHVSRKEGFNVNEIKNLVNIMASHETQIGRAIRIDAGRTGRYCRTVSPEFLNMMHRRNPLSMTTLEECWYRGNHAEYGRTQHYNESRYHMLNLHSLFHGHGTVEFRLFQFANPHDGKKGGIHAGEMKSFIQLCIAMCAPADGKREVRIQVLDAPPRVHRGRVQDRKGDSSEEHGRQQCMAQRLKRHRMPRGYGDPHPRGIRWQDGLIGCIIHMRG